VEERLERDLKVGSEDRDSLLVNWLNELIYVFDAEHILFRRFDISTLAENLLESRCYGEQFDPAKHKIKIGVKAATYHMLTVEEDTGGYKARVIFDI
jgi:SHS2 domain-containing protein